VTASAPGGTGALRELHALLAQEGGPLAGALRPPSEQLESLEAFGPLVSAGARTRSDPLTYAVLVESILEGYLLHYGSGRIVEHSDSDLRLLAGDHLYAFGLVRLATIGDLDAVDELADLISLCAQAHARAGANEAPPRDLIAGLWLLCVLAIGDGAWPALGEAKDAARVGRNGAADKVLNVAKQRARELDIQEKSERALIVFGSAVGSRLSAT
jgi:hypothetical protein